jgi:hypothetical protein
VEENLTYTNHAGLHAFDVLHYTHVVYHMEIILLWRANCEAGCLDHSWKHKQKPAICLERIQAVRRSFAGERETISTAACSFLFAFVSLFDVWSVICWLLDCRTARGTGNETPRIDRRVLGAAAGRRPQCRCTCNHVPFSKPNMWRRRLAINAGFEWDWSVPFGSPWFFCAHKHRCVYLCIYLWIHWSLFIDQPARHLLARECSIWWWWAHN